MEDLRSEKNKVRREFRKAKRDGVSLDTLQLLARQFHRLIRLHSKQKQFNSKQSSKLSMSTANRQFLRNFLEIFEEFI